MLSHPHLDQVIAALKRTPKRWVITGAAGFIGSNLLEYLLSLDQTVVAVDNFATGYKHNLEDVQRNVTAAQWARCTFIEADIRDLESCRNFTKGAEIVLHNAALGSVPRSIANPIATNETNVNGFLNVLVAAKECGGNPRVIFASSSSVYGDNTDMPKHEERTGKPLSPYAVSKVTNELYGMVFGPTYNMPIIGLRYFNVFGPRQNVNGPYAAVIPKWITALMNGEQVEIFGDGSTSRDFCYVKNVIQMNLLAATVPDTQALNRIYNTAYNARTTLNQLVSFLTERLKTAMPELKPLAPAYKDRRPGDIADSMAAIDLAKKYLKYEPQYEIRRGLDETVDWYVRNQRKPV